MTKNTKLNSEDPDYQYQSGMTRRDSLKLLAALAASTMLPLLAGCGKPAGNVAPAVPTAAAKTGEHWPELQLTPIGGKGYGKDPNLIMPPKSPWPLTMTAAQLTLLAIVADILIPRDGQVPAASEVNVPAVVDEWISAPYERQQQDRPVILAALTWLDDEATMRYQATFAKLTPAQRLTIIDDIAYNNEQTKPQFKRIANAFSHLRGLVVAAFFATPEGTKDIGYVGNVPIAGDYPGPTPEAYAHLSKVLAELGLSEFAYKA